MSSPIPPDPYVALGVPKDADISAIRTSHRKLVLKYHPDRIKDPTLKEKGKDEFQKIQQAYELLSDPTRRSRYDDRIKLAELRKDAMMRGDPAPRSYPMRPAPPQSSTGREYREDDRAFYEERRPRDARESKDSYFDSKDKFEEPLRASSRKYSDYERQSSTTKPAAKEGTGRSAKAAWGMAFTAVNVGIKIKKEAEIRKGKAHESKQEVRDREKRKARQEKEQSRKPFVVSEDDSDSDTATRVTSSTIRPSRYSREPEPSYKRSSGTARRPSYSEGDSDLESHVTSTKWETHHDRTKEYIQKATGHRPQFVRSESGQFWRGDGRRSGSDGERRPTSSKDRRSYDEPRSRPSMQSQSSAPSGLKSPRVEERVPNQRRSASGTFSSRDRESDNRKEIPGFQRSQTMPTPRSVSKKDNLPAKGSGLKHGETQDSGYGSSSSPHTPELREESPPRRAKQTSTRYRVDPSSEDDRRSRVKVLDDDSDQRRRRYHQSPEPDRRESDRRREKSERAERPSVDTHSRSKSSRDQGEMPSTRRTESARYETRSPRESPRDSPTISRHNSGRDKVYGELSPDEREPGYKYASREKVHVRPPYPEAKYSSYGRDSPDRRGHDSAHGSRFHETLRNPDSRRPSVQGS